MFEWIITMFESTWLRGIRTRAITPEDYPLDVSDVTRWAIEQYNNSTPNEFFKSYVSETHQMVWGSIHEQPTCKNG